MADLILVDYEQLTTAGKAVYTETLEAAALLLTGVSGIAADKLFLSCGQELRLTGGV